MDEWGSTAWGLNDREMRFIGLSLWFWLYLLYIIERSITGSSK